MWPVHCQSPSFTLNERTSGIVQAAARQSGKESWSTQLSLEPGTANAQRWGAAGENLKALPLPGQSKLITVPYNESTLKLLLCSEPYSQVQHNYTKDDLVILHTIDS